MLMKSQVSNLDAAHVYVSFDREVKNHDFLLFDISGVFSINNLLTFSITTEKII